VSALAPSVLAEGRILRPNNDSSFSAADLCMIVSAYHFSPLQIQSQQISVENIAIEKSSSRLPFAYFQLQFGIELFPDRVSCCCCVPSASIVQISVCPPTVR
jgi:hypothetical protein